MPRGVRTRRTASAAQRGRRLREAFVAGVRKAPAAKTAAGEVGRNTEGSERCKNATTPDETNASATPAMVRWPSIIAGIATLNG